MSKYYAVFCELSSKTKDKNEDKGQEKINLIKFYSIILISTILAVNFFLPLVITILNGVLCENAKVFENRLSLNEICEGIFFEALPFPNDNNFFIGCIRGEGKNP